jgi:hypothetical protein
MRIIEIFLSFLMLAQIGAAQAETPQAKPENAEYAGFFDFDFDKTPESFYYADGTFYIFSEKNENMLNFKPKYPKIYEVYSTYYKDEKTTRIGFGDDYKKQVFSLEFENGKLKVSKHDTYVYNEYSGNVGALVVPAELKVQAYYFGEALMNTPDQFADGTAKTRFDYFLSETYRNSEDDYSRALFADVINGKPVMVEMYHSNVYFDGKDITPEDYSDNSIGSYYRVENQIATTGMSGMSTVFIFRMSENGITESEISHLGNELNRPDPNRNEYFLTNGVEFDGGFNFSFGGRVFKDNCYYKTEDGSYREYGGIDVPIGNFLSLDGAVEAIAPYLENSTKLGNADFETIINNIQWRENNTFTVNLIDLPKENYENAFQSFVVFRYENNEFSVLYGSSGYSENSQSAEYGDDIATYPDTFPGDTGITWQH